MNDKLPGDILKLFLKKEYSLICKNWYKEWIKKPILINITDYSPKSLVDEITKFNISELYFINYYPSDNIFCELPNLNKITFCSVNTITNDEIKKFTNITSLELIKNNTITNESLNYLTNLTDLNLDYYDNLNNEFPFDFCTNIKKLSLTLSDTYKLPPHHMY